jgi:hypothetical protein
MLARTRRGFSFGIILYFVTFFVPSVWASGAEAGGTNRLDSGITGLTAELPSSQATSDISEGATIGQDSFTVGPLTLNLLDTGTASESTTIGSGQTSGDLRQRIDRARNAKQYAVVLGYVEIGLKESPWDIGLQEMKGIALAKLHRYRAAIAVFRDALIMQTNDQDLVTSLAELQLINGEVDGYHTLKLEYRAMVESAYEGLLTKYFDVLETYNAGNEEQVRMAGVKLLMALPSSGSSRLSNWDFEDLLYVTGGQPPSRKKSMLLTVVRVLMGELQRDRGIELLNSP